MNRRITVSLSKEVLEILKRAPKGSTSKIIDWTLRAAFNLGPTPELKAMHEFHQQQLKERKS